MAKVAARVAARAVETAVARAVVRAVARAAGGMAEAAMEEEVPVAAAGSAVAMERVVAGKVVVS